MPPLRYNVVVDPGVVNIEVVFSSNKGLDDIAEALARPKYFKLSGRGNQSVSLTAETHHSDDKLKAEIEKVLSTCGRTDGIVKLQRTTTVRVVFSASFLDTTVTAEQRGRTIQ